MTEAALVEGHVKLRDGKKWKSRWLVLRKPSPVADCLLMLAYKDRAERARGMRERSSLALEDICGLEPGLPYEGLAHTLAIVCLSQAVMLGFDSREAMCAWDARIRHALGEVHRFHVTVAPGTKLESGPATLHLCNDILVVARDVPPAVTGQWKLSDLRRYGAVPSGFIFEGGTRPERRGPCRGGARGPGGPGSPAAGEAAQPSLPLRLAGQRRGRPQPVQLVVRGQPLRRQRQQPARAVARAVPVLGGRDAGGSRAGSRPGPRGGRSRCLEATPQAAAATAAAGGRPPELLGQRHRHGQPLLLLGQLLVLRRKQPGRVARGRGAGLSAQPAGRRGARARPVRLRPRGGRVPGAHRAAAPLRHAPQPAPGGPGPAPRHTGQRQRRSRRGLGRPAGGGVSLRLAGRATAGTGDRGPVGAGRALGSGRPPRGAPSGSLFRVSRLRRTEGKCASLRAAAAGGRCPRGAALVPWGGLGVQPAGRAAAGSAFWKVGGRVRGGAQGPGAKSNRSLRPTSLRVALCPRGFTCLRAQVVCPLGGLLRPRRPRGLLGVWLSGPRRLTHSRHFLNLRAPGGGAGGEGQGRGHLPGAPSALLAEPGAGGQDQRTRGSGWRSHSGAPGTAGGPPAGVALPPRRPRSARPALLHGFWLRGLVCPFALRFQTPTWKARPVSVRCGLRPAASRTQLSCNCFALYLRCWLKPHVALHT
ncbi:protein Dok-7 isoform X3 [Orcinus orca]|uniref:protein Dok-7 isoform X3 n=1 Tax=Orcinus orca TaxID=9733 RepID=UPI0014418B9F|nr:protein Dok-7 isoform X3 [Orcinus orca]